MDSIDRIEAWKNEKITERGEHPMSRKLSPGFPNGRWRTSSGTTLKYEADALKRLSGDTENRLIMVCALDDVVDAYIAGREHK